MEKKKKKAAKLREPAGRPRPSLPPTARFGRPVPVTFRPLFIVLAPPSAFPSVSALPLFRSPRLTRVVNEPPGAALSPRHGKVPALERSPRWIASGQSALRDALVCPPLPSSSGLRTDGPGRQASSLRALPASPRPVTFPPGPG